MSPGSMQEPKGRQPEVGVGFIDEWEGRQERAKKHQKNKRHIRWYVPGVQTWGCWQVRGLSSACLWAFPTFVKKKKTTSWTQTAVWNPEVKPFAEQIGNVERILVRLLIVPLQWEAQCLLGINWCIVCVCTVCACVFSASVAHVAADPLLLCCYPQCWHSDS